MEGRSSLYEDNLSVNFLDIIYSVLRNKESLADLTRGIFVSMRAQRFIASTSIDKSNLALRATSTLQKLPSLKTEHASTCENMRARANEHPLKFCEQFELK